MVSDFTRSWFWKSLRWFHAAAFTPVLMVMVLGIGVQMSNGVAAHLADGAQKSVGTALPAVMLILVSVVAPLALFKLLAFVDPGTPSGASFRQGMAIQGGLQGLLGGGASGGGSSAASAMDPSGRSGGEQSAEASTGDRFNKSTQGFLGSFGPVGQAMSTGMGWINSAGAKATSLMSDETNQAGVGQSTYGPDFSGLGGRQSGGQSGGSVRRHPPRVAEQRRPRRHGPAEPADAARTSHSADPAHGRWPRRRLRRPGRLLRWSRWRGSRTQDTGCRRRGSGWRCAVAPEQLAGSPRSRSNPIRATPHTDPDEMEGTHR